jgi:hypothetical protein
MKKKTTEEFKLLAKKIHNDKYDYSLVEYKGAFDKIKVICPIHGLFEQGASKHLFSKHGCPKCSFLSNSNKQRKTIDVFISQAKKIHNDKYDYSLIEYINKKSNIKIICPIHGLFEQTPDNHLSGKGCKHCGGTFKMNNESFIVKAKKIHNDKYDYSLVDYKKSSTNIKIICPNHGLFEQTPNNHISKGYGCRKCSVDVIDTESFIIKAKKIHNNKYDYSLVDYKKSSTNIKIICPNHGIYEQMPMVHLKNFGCKKCSNNGISIKEKEVVSFIKLLNIKLIENDLKILGGKELDIYLPNNNLAIEYNGLYWHSDLFLNNDYHLNKTNLCENKGIKLLHIFEDEWLDNKKIIKSIIKNSLNLIDNKIHSNECEIKLINKPESIDFLNKNNIQKNIKTKINLGLFYNNELITLSTFNNYNKKINNIKSKDNYELTSFTNKIDFHVVDGYKILLDYFIKYYKPINIICSVDRRWGGYDIYESLGFKFIKDTKPNYWYLIINNKNERHKYKNNLEIKNKIYDSGNKIYLLTL